MIRLRSGQGVLFGRVVGGSPGGWRRGFVGLRLAIDDELLFDGIVEEFFFFIAKMRLGVVSIIGVAEDS